jgi:DNA-binding response OmpR family regulator
MSAVPARIVVVADPVEAERMSRWLAAAGLGEVQAADGGDGTLAELSQRPADVVVLCAGLAGFDALVFSLALREQAPNTHTALVLVGEQRGPVRTALDAIDFGADRFLRRPLSRAALEFAVRSCLELAAGVAGAVIKAQPGAGGVSTPLALGEVIHAATPGVMPARAADVSSDVAVHALIHRLEEATTEAIDAFLHDLTENTLASPDAYPAAPDPAAPDHPPARDLADSGEYAHYSAVASASPPASAQAPRRHPTEVVTIMPARRAAATDAAAAETGTLVSEVRKHMSAVEARWFGPATGTDPALGARAAVEPPPGDIDLDAIAAATVPGILPREARARSPQPGPLSDEPDRALPPAPTVRGDLRDEEPAFLIARLWREGFSGRVTFRRGDVHKGVYFEDGRPVFATSNLPHDRMGDLLYREGKITREQHARSREIVAETGRRMGEILVEMGFLKRRELLPAVRRHVEDVVYSLFSWDSGAYATTPGDTAAGERIRLATHPAALVLEGIRRKISPERLRARLGGPGAVVTPLKRDEIAQALIDADLSPEERRVAELFDGRRTLAEVAAAPEAAGLDPAAVYHLAHGLAALGLVRVTDRGRELPSAGRSGSQPMAPASAITGAGDLAIDRERVLAKHAHARDADYFTVLGVRRDATSFEIRRAYEAARRDYAAEAFPKEVQRDLQAELAEIALVLDEAQRVLRNDQVRAQYLANLRE